MFDFPGKRWNWPRLHVLRATEDPNVTTLNWTGLRSWLVSILMLFAVAQSWSSERYSVQVRLEMLTGRPLSSLSTRTLLPGSGASPPSLPYHARACSARF